MRKNVLPGTYVLTRCKSQCCLEVGVCKSVSYALFDNFIKVFFFKIRIFAAVYFMWCHKKSNSILDQMG